MSSKLLILGMLAVLWLVQPGAAWADSATNRFFAARAEKALAQAREIYLADTNSNTNAWQFARASFDLADLASNDTQRAEISQRGIEVSRQWLARESNSAPGHFYLAMNLGQLARAEAPSLPAYRLVFEVEREFKSAAELDVRFNHAGPARTLGQLYFEAPIWPLSVGSRAKAREWYERAAELAPDYPVNQLNLAGARLKWRQREEFEATWKKLEASWPMARTNFTGEKWEQSWFEWETRRAAIKADYQEIYDEKL